MLRALKTYAITARAKAGAVRVVGAHDISRTSYYWGKKEERLTKVRTFAILRREHLHMMSESRLICKRVHFDRGNGGRHIDPDPDWYYRTTPEGAKTSTIDS